MKLPGAPASGKAATATDHATSEWPGKAVASAEFMTEV